MRLTVQLMLAIAALPALAAAAGAEMMRAESTVTGKEIYVATYFEVAARSARDGTKLLKDYRDASRKENGNLRAEVAQEIGRPNRFVALEIWSDQAAFDAHGKTAGTTTFRDRFKTMQNGPYDERVHNSLNVGPNDPVKQKGAVFVVSHVDVPPPRKDEVIAALNPLAESNRKADGNQRYEVQQQNSRPNHFTVVEAWKTEAAYQARSSSAPQRQFRDKLGPMLGALYDERLYHSLD